MAHKPAPRSDCPALIPPAWPRGDPALGVCQSPTMLWSGFILPAPPTAKTADKKGTASNSRPTGGGNRKGGGVLSHLPWLGTKCGTSGGTTAGGNLCYAQVDSRTVTAWPWEQRVRSHTLLPVAGESSRLWGGAEQSCGLLDAEETDQLELRLAESGCHNL